MNRKLLIFLDKTVFIIIFYGILILSYLRKSPPPIYNPEIEPSASFLVIRPGGLGDALMSIPFLKVLRNRFPNSRITVICVKKNARSLQHLPFIDEILILDSIENSAKNLATFFWSKFDIVFDLEPFRKISSIVAYLSGAAIRIGFDTNIRRRLYTHFVTYHNEASFESVNMIRQLKILNIHVTENDSTDMGFALPASAEKKIATIFQSHGISPQIDSLIAIAPGVLKPHHRWRMSRFAELIDLIMTENSKTKILLLGAPADIPDARAVLQNLSSKSTVVNLVGQTSFMEAFGILKACKILMACDGGIVYVAAAMGCSTISIWGPGVMARFKPPGDNHVGIRKSYFCVPCVNYSRLGEFPDCPYGRRCITDISAKDVFQEYLLLKTRLLPQQN